MKSEFFVFSFECMHYNYWVEIIYPLMVAIFLSEFLRTGWLEFDWQTKNWLTYDQRMYETNANQVWANVMNEEKKNMQIDTLRQSNEDFMLFKDPHKKFTTACDGKLQWTLCISSVKHYIIGSRLGDQNTCCCFFLCSWALAVRKMRSYSSKSENGTLEFKLCKLEKDITIQITKTIHCQSPADLNDAINLY